jgi:hypothetical protein
MAAAFVSILLSGSAKADIIGVQWYSTGTGSAGSNTAPSAALTATENAGVTSDSTNGNASYLQDNWNTVGVASPGSLVTGSIAAASLNNSGGVANSLGIALSWDSGDSGGSHKGGTYNTEATVTSPDLSGNYQSVLMGAMLTVNSNSSNSYAEFTNVPTSGYTYTLVAYTVDYGTSVMRLQIGGGTGQGALAPPTVGGAGGYGLNSVTGSDAVYAVMQSGNQSVSHVTVGLTDGSLDNVTTFSSDPIAYISNSSPASVTLPTTASNFVSWENVTPDSSGNIQVSWFKYGGNVTSDTIETVEGVNAVQLIATAVPEPTTVGLLALGGAALLMRRRKAAKDIA